MAPTVGWAAPTSAPLARAAVEAGAAQRLLKAGDRPLLHTDVELEVLWPDAGDRDLEENERSLVLRLKYGRHAFLLTGRAEYRQWVLDYVEAWAERIRANDGICPDNVGLGGRIPLDTMRTEAGAREVENLLGRIEHGVLS